LISSGIERSKLRRPASTWATGIDRLTATNEQATVEYDDDEVGRHLLVEEAVERLHDPRGLNRVRRRPDAQVELRSGHPEIAKERSRHLVVVVLPRVHDEGLEALAASQRQSQRRNLDEVRPRAGDQENPHARSGTFHTDS
jgi:hypothetical protein